MIVETTDQSAGDGTRQALEKLAMAIEQIATTLQRSIADNDAKFRTMQEYVEKTLHISSVHYALYGERSARPYYPLNDTWALTRLDSGQNFFINTADRNITPWIIMGGHWERNVERVLMDYIRPGMHVLDIGAHFGYYTVKLGGKLQGFGKLQSFEPNPEVNVVAEENIKINSLANLTCLHKYALGDQTSRATLTRSNSNMSSANLIGEQASDYSVVVDVKRLDDVLDVSDKIDLIKLDAEGYEKKILDGAAHTLARSPNCAIMIELSLDRWEKAASLDQLIPACGGGKELYAVRADGMLEHYTLDRIRPFLLTCDFHENYFLVAPRRQVQALVSHLLVV